MSLIKIYKHGILGMLLLIACSESNKVESYKNLKDDLKNNENIKVIPKANVHELEMEVNNGGFNQYFFNSSGQNCFATLRRIEERGMSQTAAILRKAIDLINPDSLSEEHLIKKLQERKVKELDDEKIIEQLDSLDVLFLNYPDGSLN